MAIKTTRQTAAALAIVMVLAVAALAVTGADTSPKRRGQEVHLFEVTARVLDAMDDDYNYQLLATVLGRWVRPLDLKFLIFQAPLTRSFLLSFS
jgi:hypothetical protein